MSANHLEILVEEPSMENFLHALLPRMIPAGKTYAIRTFQGKSDLLAKAEARLGAYANYIPEDWRIIIVVDRDEDDCKELRSNLEEIAKRSGLIPKSTGSARWNFVTRIVVEELEAWYFGDWQAVKAVFPRVASTVDKQKAYRKPDSIRGGTWEAFERIMKGYGYFAEGLPKINAARLIGAKIDPGRNISESFNAFIGAVRSAID
ncbi:DUF4276 family protein [Xanthomonas vasicola pv. arecae]|uniref:DUF4276 family protein n=1 Tax=Xanthomonas vasicola TaxID=56459 RepID=UPI00052C6795|nr:DUF4276 family protein [Xanthomonas vasicola]AZR28172.1 DUF4276 family protein [Xanthomonas vasicola pv. arecae]